MKALHKHQAWTNLLVFEDLDAARAVEAYLHGKGFEARTYDDKVYRAFLFLRPPRVTYQVQVRRDHLKSADFLLRNSAPELLTKAFSCPECHSLRVAYPQMTRKFILPTILLHLGIIFRVTEHECYCEHCHLTWHLPVEVAHPIMKPA